MEELKYLKKVTKLIENPPKGTRWIYDARNCRMFLIFDSMSFVEGKSGHAGTSWHGVLTPVNEPNGNVGNEPDSVIGDIEISLEAVQDGWG